MTIMTKFIQNSQQKIWDLIAPNWNNYRQKPLNELLKLNWKKGKILDLGCGNCRNLIPFKDLECYGLDFSKSMLEQSKKFSKKHNFKVSLTQSDLEKKLPYKSSSFNYVLAIASLHHLSNPEFTIKEISRILKKNGEAYITVWNKLQPKFLFRKKRTLIPWKQKSQTLMRYYHFIGYLELKSLLRKNNFTILKSGFGKNITFHVRLDKI